MPGASYLSAREYCWNIRRLNQAIESTKQAIEYQKTRGGLRGYKITEKTTGTKSKDGLELEAIETLERVQRLTDELERYQAELVEESKILKRLSRKDQQLIRREFIEYTVTDEYKPQPYRPPTRETLSEFFAPYEALQRLYEVLPPTWKTPKAI